jgi:cytochrome c2
MDFCKRSNIGISFCGGKMVSRIRFAVGIALLLALVWVIPAWAGGWAVITLDKLPGEVAAGEPVTIGFTVRQHGRTLMSGLTPTVTARLPGTSKAVVVDADAEGDVGHYTAQLTLPEPGAWDWSIQAFTMDQPMPPLTVIAQTEQKTAQVLPLSTVPLWGIVAGIIGAASCLAAATLVFRHKLQQAVPLFMIGVTLGIAGFLSANDTSPRVQAFSPSHNLSQVEVGKQLFVAKGCTTCHVHADITRATDSFYVDVGPNLTTYTKASPEFLQMWLKDPASIKPETVMPDLKLSKAEIDALVAFLTVKR